MSAAPARKVDPKEAARAAAIAAQARAEDRLRAKLPYATKEQADPFRCYSCGERETKDRLLVPVLKQPLKRNSWHWICRGACMELHSAKCRSEREFARTGVSP